MGSKRHHRCNLCGKDFETGEKLEDHLDRRHPKEDVHWWVVAERPDRDLQFEGR
ncbi:MAG: C2H2-type zinc finger protein [Haloferacaceae archaeon]